MNICSDCLKMSVCEATAFLIEMNSIFGNLGDDNEELTFEMHACPYGGPYCGEDKGVPHD